MLKKLLMALLALALLAGTVFGIIVYATQGVAKAADAFVEAARGADVERMKPLMSQGFLQSIPDDQFAGYLRHHGLDDIRSTSWTSRSISNDRGQVAGKVTLGNGTEMRVAISLVYENEAWKVEQITKE